MKYRHLFLFVALFATTALGASNTITYTATVKLPETVSEYDGGLHTNAFNVAISSHTFSNGEGTITFVGDVTTIGESAFSWCTSLTSITIPNSVTTIALYAFSQCFGLTSITIPNSVTTIGDWAFCNCWGLTSITIPNSVTTIGDHAFRYCSGLTSITIPNSVTTIGNYAFFECSGLTSVTIPNSVITIGEDAFNYCSGLTSITIPNSVTTIGEEAFKYCSSLTSVTIPNSVTTIGDYAFSECSGLTSVTIPNSVTTIGDFAFYGCSGLISPVYNNNYFAYMPQSHQGTYVIPDGIKQIAGGAFQFCSGLTSVTIGNSVTTIGKCAFEFCSSLTSVTIGNSVTTIGDFAFYYCSGLTSVTIGNSVKTIGSSAFEGCKGLKTVYNNSNLNITKGSTANGYVAYYADKVYKGIPVGDFIIKQDTIVTAYIGSATDIVIPNFVTTIGNSAFEDCDDLTSIIISNSVTSIGERAFYGLSNKDFKTIEVSNSVETIGKYAFANCSYLKTITLGSKLEDIDEYAFQNDERLLYVNCYAEEPPILQENAFDNYDIYLQVPCGVLDEYKVAKGWKLFNKENVSCISAEETPITADDVTVVPADNQAIFTWPQNEQAAGYSIEITKDGVVFCTLKFNGQGQLTGIAFAPGRGGEQRTMPAAEMTANGWQFTVTGLDQASKYSYALDALNAAQQSIKHYQGEFYTNGYTGLDGFTIDGAQCTMKKMIIDNQLFIFRGNQLYNVSGQKVR